MIDNARKGEKEVSGCWGSVRMMSPVVALEKQVQIVGTPSMDSPLISLWLRFQQKA